MPKVRWPALTTTLVALVLAQPAYGLGAFVDNGEPGNGHFELLANSPAIDAGNDNACTKRDQIGEQRRKICDIGAVEFSDKKRQKP
jgi:hypothetical protein